MPGHHLGNSISPTHIICKIKKYKEKQNTILYGKGRPRGKKNSKFKYTIKFSSFIIFFFEEPFSLLRLEMVLDFPRDVSLARRSESVGSCNKPTDSYGALL